MQLGGILYMETRQHKYPTLCIKSPEDGKERLSALAKKVTVGLYWLTRGKVRDKRAAYKHNI
jgi:hypothetical protein